jgi:hypothetical protein
MNLVEKQFIMFKLFLSMNGIYLNDEMSLNIHNAFVLAHNENIDYANITDAYLWEVVQGITKGENIHKKVE